jgi:alpha-L-rhamnosidase
MLKEGATFTWESWDARQTGDSESHGWGSTVLAVLQDDILGVRAIEPGAARVAIGIPNSSITSAHGVVATQRGPIAIAWTRTGTHTKLDVTIPPNVVAQLPGSDHNLGSGHHVLRDYKLPAKSDHSISWLLVALGIAIAVIALVGIVWLLRRRRPA